MKSWPVVLKVFALAVLVVPFVLLAFEGDARQALGASGFFLLLSASGVLVLPAAYLARDWLSSLRITVVLLAIGLVLIFVGTLALTEAGIWVVINDYFRSIYVWVPLDIFRQSLWPSEGKPLPGEVLFPGGFLVMGLLMVNLVAAHAVRYKVTAKGSKFAAGVLLTQLSVVMFALTVGIPSFSRAIQQDVMLMLGIWALPMAVGTAAAVMLFGSRKAGIVLIHVGLVVMLLSEFVTGLAAEEGQMAIAEYGSSNIIYDIREPELAFVTPRDGGGEKQVVIPRSKLTESAGSGKPITHPALPVQIRIDKYMANSLPVPDGLIDGNPSRLAWQVREEAVFDGFDQKVDNPSMLVSLIDDGKVVGRHTVSTFDVIRPIELELDGQRHRLELRFKRNYLPYSIQLHNFRNDKFTGTQTPMNYSSDLRLVEGGGLARDVFVKMNQPLRHDGKAFFQQGFFQDPTNMNTGTILQTADNPGAWMPYLACVIVTVGLCAQFGASLLRYGRRTAAKGVGG